MLLQVPNLLKTNLIQTCQSIVTMLLLRNNSREEVSE